MMRRARPANCCHHPQHPRPHPGPRAHGPRGRPRNGGRLQAAALLPDVPDVVVTPSWLARHLDAVALLDVRGRVDTRATEPGVEQSQYTADYDAYLQGHIPGAVFIDWLRDGVDQRDGVPVQLQTDPALFAAAVEAKGVSHDRPVVVYDSGDGLLAARLWWMLTCHGHPQVLVLERGWAAWVEAGLPTELHEPCTLKVYSYYDASPRLQHRATAQDLQQAAVCGSDGGGGGAAQEDLLVIDTRSAEQWSGAVRRGPRGGRIPGAVSLPRSRLVDAGTGWWLPLEQQREALAGCGVRLPCAEVAQQQQQQQQQQQRVVLYCNGGVAACTAALALHRLGVRAWSVYDGSWNEWGARLDWPVARD